MLKQLKKKISILVSAKHLPDVSLLVALGILLTFGLLMLFLASSAVSYAKYGNTYFYFTHQLFVLIPSLILFYAAIKIDYHWWRKFAGFFLFFSIFLLILVFIPGIQAEHGTARSWINIFGQSFQPSELVKIAFLIYLSTWLEAKRENLSRFSEGMVPFLLTLIVISLLMLAQPDLGTLFIIIFTAMTVFFAAGGKLSHIIGLVLLGSALLLIIVGWQASYQSDRFKCLQDPSYSALDKCYQINQSMIAVGSGGLFGRGLGESRQKYMYLPEVWGDSIFPIIAEESGFIFSSLLVLLYLFIFYRGLMIARAAPDIYGSSLAIGIVVWLATQTFLNIGGMINLIPMTGVPLPLVSAAGSSTLSVLLALGILVNISRQTKEEPSHYQRRL